MTRVTTIDRVAVTRRAPRPRLRGLDPEVAATALLLALGESDTPLDQVLRQVGEICGMPSVAFWKPDGRRLLLAHRHGDDALAPDAQISRQLTGTDQDEASTQGIPLHIPDTGGREPRVMTIQGRSFGAVATGGGLLAVGPFSDHELSRRARRELEILGALVDSPVRQALRIGALTAQVTSLRQEADLHRRSLGSATDEATSLGLLLDLAVTTSGSTGGFVAVRDGARLRTIAARSLPTGFEALDLTPGGGVLATIPGAPGVLFVEGHDALVGLGIGGLVVVGGPADADQTEIVIGLLADNQSVLEPGCAPMLNTLVSVVAIVMESTQAARGTAARHLAALEALCRALDTRAQSTRGHHSRVAYVAGAIADRLGLATERRQLVITAALVHDVGLIAATSDGAIAAEFAHPTVGADMVALVPGAAELAPLVRAHHEWWDGFGFPNGLVGEAIPVEARVLAAAEFYVETRQADGPLKTDALIAEVHARAGGQLDPACAQALVSIIEES